MRYHKKIVIFILLFTIPSHAFSVWSLFHYPYTIVLLGTYHYLCSWGNLFLPATRKDFKKFKTNFKNKADQKFRTSETIITRHIDTLFETTQKGLHAVDTRVNLNKESLATLVNVSRETNNENIQLIKNNHIFHMAELNKKFEAFVTSHIASTKKSLDEIIKENNKRHDELQQQLRDINHNLIVAQKNNEIIQENIAYTIQELTRENKTQLNDKNKSFQEELKTKHEELQQSHENITKTIESLQEKISETNNHHEQRQQEIETYIQRMAIITATLKKRNIEIQPGIAARAWSTG